ncbi:MAG: hypothetical protein ACSHX3_13860 [Litorimonas sp.]
MSMEWKEGRGKMGFMAPLIGQWIAIDPETPMGRVECLRTYEKILDGKYIRLQADWDIGDGEKTYREIAHYGLNADKLPAFWSFTSDGGQSYGELADVSDMADGAKGFHANMPSGLARFGFWSTGDSMIWAAEAQTKQGWKSMIWHDCRRV